MPDLPSSTWITEHYRTDVVADTPLLRCRRCDMVVTWLTKHAVERHGDPLDVVQPVLHREPIELLW